MTARANNHLKDETNHMTSPKTIQKMKPIK